MYLMDSEKAILKDPQITKFSLYGFFKNLKFFEPYLLVYLISNGLNLFQVGLLQAVMEGTVYLLEIPTGLIADHYGRKKALTASFLFYIASFGLFFAGRSFSLFAAAMVFFGIGEAFRSGTHKAMIYRYLDIREWASFKTLVYGRTRSFSLLGTALSSVAAIALALHLPALRIIFLVAVVPYLADILLILSYPGNLDEERSPDRPPLSFFSFTGEVFKTLGHQKSLRRVIINSALFDSVFKTVKDYIQPITLAYLALPAAWSLVLDKEAGEKVILGLLYAAFALFGALASRYVHRLVPRFGVAGLADRYALITSLLFFAITLFLRLDFFFPVVLFYLFLNILKDSRRPLLVQAIGDLAQKEGRATVLSVESQLKSLLTILFAPLFGLLAQTVSIPFAFLILGGIMALLSFVLKIQETEGGSV